MRKKIIRLRDCDRIFEAKCEDANCYCDNINPFKFLKTNDYINKSCEDLFLECWESDKEDKVHQVCFDIHKGCEMR